MNEVGASAFIGRDKENWYTLVKVCTLHNLLLHSNEVEFLHSNDVELHVDLLKSHFIESKVILMKWNFYIKMTWNSSKVILRNSYIEMTWS